MQSVSRRTFFVKGSVAAAGVTGAAAIGLPLSNASASEPPLDDFEIESADPVLVDIVDVSTGEVEILIGDRSISFIDKPLVARIVRASR